MSAVFVAYLLFSVLFFALGPYQDVEAAGGIVDDDFGASGPAILEAVEALGAAGQDAYTTFLLGDMLYALLQGAWMAGFILIGARHWKRLPTWTPLIAVAATALDWLENLAFLAIIAQPSDAIGWVAAVAMHLKLVAVIASVAAVLAVLGYWIIHPLHRRPRRARTPARGAPGSAGRGRAQHGQGRTRGR